VSIAETKTLAKAASEVARHRGGAICFWGHPERDAILASMPVERIWGVGHRWAKRLTFDDAATAAGLAALDDSHLRRHYNVVLLRTALELRGVSCVPLDQAPPARRSLVRSRMFREPLTDPALIARAIGMHAARAAEMLRHDGLAASVVEAFVTTGRHGTPAHHGRALAELPTATNDTFALVRAARSLVDACVTPRGGGQPRFKKAGVMLSGIVPAGRAQGHLFDVPVREHPALMEAVDRIARRFGREAVVVAAQGSPDELRAVHAGQSPAWGMKREHLSPRYTTRWDELPVVRV